MKNILIIFILNNSNNKDVKLGYIAAPMPFLFIGGGGDNR